MIMTVRELQKAIRVASMRISESYEKLINRKKKASKTDKNLAQRKVEAMRYKYGEGRKGLLKLGFRGRKKAELETQLSEFESFAGFLETTGQRTRQRKATQTHAAYEKFKENYGFKDLKYSDYKSLVTIFGAVGDKTVNQFGSNNLVELYNYADEEQKSNFLESMLEVINESKGQGWTTEELYDEMLFRIENEQELKQKAKHGGKRK